MIIILGLNQRSDSRLGSKSDPGCRGLGRGRQAGAWLSRAAIAASVVVILCTAAHTELASLVDLLENLTPQ